MEKFIRVDVIGEWRGKDHNSFIGGHNDDETMAEGGISCYELDDKDITQGIEKLYHYWFKFCMADLSDFYNSQITIFEGYHTGNYGCDDEDLATCEETLAELNAIEFFKNVIELKELLEEEEIDEEEYEKKLEDLVRNRKGLEK